MIEKLYGKNINFLIGSGASFGVIPTLSTEIMEEDRNLSIEDILEKNEGNLNIQNIVYSYYYNKILKPSFLTEIDNENSVFNNYKMFLEEIIKFLQRENYQKEKRINIFTTNYDLFFEKVADELIGKYEFFFNDGSSGNIKRKLSMKNFHKKIYHTGVFDNFNREIPIINLFKIHGSVSWTYLRDQEYSKVLEIEVNYNDVQEEIKYLKIDNISEDTIKKSVDPSLEIRKNLRNKFVLVFPEKDKFEETLYKEFYYQYLRQLSYELEKNNSVLIVFGFSFADEHIAELIKRSLNNPAIKIYIFCFNKKSKEQIEKNLYIPKDNKIEFILPEDDGEIKFSGFIKKLFNKDKSVEGEKDE